MARLGSAAGTMRGAASIVQPNTTVRTGQSDLSLFNPSLELEILGTTQLCTFIHVSYFKVLNLADIGPVLVPTRYLNFYCMLVLEH